jgi:endogenous inhibitor of DNA gyrase (YacG/DUF329 family)
MSAIRRPGYKWVSKNGYIYVYCHIRKRSIEEHRKIMADHLGRELTQDEQVHHKNRNRSDNRIENLEVVTRSAHAERHRTVHERTCPTCGAIFRPTHDNARFCSIRCSKLKGRNVPCAQCGKLVWKKPYSLKTYERHFCTEECLGAYRAAHWQAIIGDKISAYRRARSKDYRGQHDQCSQDQR